MIQNAPPENGERRFTLLLYTTISICQGLFEYLCRISQYPMHNIHNIPYNMHFMHIQPYSVIEILCAVHAQCIALHIGKP